MNENISKEEALKVALRHLVADARKKFKSGLKLSDGVPDGLPLYMRSGAASEHCWCIFVPQLEGSPAVGAGRYICIAKKTGEVIFDGRAGE